MPVSPHIPHIAIIGGGFSGAALAWHLARDTSTPRRITVFEPRPFLGAGLAYGATDPQHRVNVPATRMSIDTSQPDDFARWIGQTDALANDPAAFRPDGSAFPARAIFGRYVANRLAPVLHAGVVTHLRHKVAGVYRSSVGHWIITDVMGQATAADIVVIATSHPAPQPPKLLRDLHLHAGRHPVLVTNPWQAGALEDIRTSDRVLIVGTGLSMADAIVTLTARGHDGKITAISRRGQRSHGHAAHAVDPVGQFISPPSRTVGHLLRRVRHALAAHPDQPWQAIFDRLREQAPDIWAALPLPERRRLIRHLRPFWDTHRFRIAPQAEDVLHARERAGTLDITAARLAAVQVKRDRFVTTLRHGDTVWGGTYDTIITTTGPAHDAIIHTVPYIRELAAAGLVEMDATGLGLHVDALGRACVGSGHEDTLFVAGPLARGRFGELMGLPEVTRHAEKLAVIISALSASLPIVHYPEKERATT
ncbi:FAD/NAD(P)-binding protein [Komagataeibacter sp. FXV3]|uniref:FAD/NAD(P)-binding protein n=1 Tax=Komagataeibacter sp. FXV3 TaxID=2608998 RepID=UPI00187B5E24|nr:FAD-dependent oxidoreductase [Komagataeibacter sp. FXV3]MBE7730225.1 FAD-dependent oxidoreductase [Komagataeibacter sp. FXV3]